MPVTMNTSDYASLSGDIDVDGSSTVFPITEAVAEEFGKLTDGSVRVTVGVSGTGGGFKKFCNGETQISDASRPSRPARSSFAPTPASSISRFPWPLTA